MISSFTNILLNEDIDNLLNTPQVLDAKKNLDDKSSGSVYFSIELTQSIKDLIYEKISLNLSNVKSIPMRWIKGDTMPHIDKGVDCFNKTYLIYLTDSPGELIVDGNSFPILKNNAYVFNEGLDHKTINTGLEHRLLLGPMSEKAFAVGGLEPTIMGPGGTSIYLRDNSALIEYSYDQVSWAYIPGWPCKIENTNTSAGFLKIELTTDIYLNNFFIFNTTHIQFGSESLKDNGYRPIIYINNIFGGYNGALRNGTDTMNGNDYIYVFNLDIRAIGDIPEYKSILMPQSGWIGQIYFGAGASNNYIINCSSDGDINSGSGGIVGSFAACNGGNLTIIGCSTYGGLIYNGAGGILGDNAAYNGGTILCKSCWNQSTNITDNAGGISGIFTGEESGSVTISDCYTLGTISGSYAGGIIGYNGGVRNGTVVINNCYSEGQITGYYAGGIIGTVDNTGLNNIGSITISNCYTTGNTDTNVGAGAITGQFINSPNVIISHCYTTGSVTGDYGYFIGNSGDDIIPTCYSEAYNHGTGWNSINADTVLTGVPTGSVGTTWVSIGIGIGYQLFNMGYTPYTINNISGTPPNLVRSYDITVARGNSSTRGIKNAFYAIFGGSDTITIDPLTGAINTTISTILDTYTMYIYNTGSYNITQLNLTVIDSLPCLTEDTLVLTPNGYININKLNKGDNVITSDNRVVEIKNIFKSNVIGNHKTYPCIVHKNSIAYNYPSNDFKISQGHLIKFNNTWILPNLFFPLDKSKKLIKYYHIKLENYITDHLVINHGVVVESLGSNSKDSLEYKKRLLTMDKKSKLHFQLNKYGHKCV
jgi:hypothetical protein